MKTALALLLLPLAQLAAQDPETITVTLRDGRSERIQPLELKGDVARFKVMVLGGEMTCTRKLAEFAPESAFRVEAFAAQPKTFTEHFQLAKKAADMDLLPQAGAEGRKAIESAKADADAAAKTGQVRAWAADTLEAKLAAAVAKKDLEAAKRLLGLLSTRLADQRSEEQLAALAESVDALQQADADDRRTARQAKVDAKAREAAQQRLKPIYDRIAQGDKQQKSGIAQSKNTSQSARQCEQSIDSYKVAWKAMQELGKKYPDDAELGQELLAISERVQQAALRSALHAANMLTVQSDYKGALDWTSRILKFDPDNAEAKAMMQTIQLAAASAGDQWGWSWPIVSGGVPRPQ